MSFLTTARALFVLFSAGAVAAGCSTSDDPEEAIVGTAESALSDSEGDLPLRFFVLTDPSILRSFSLQSVMEQLIRTRNPTASDASLTAAATDLYQQWWDISNPVAASSRPNTPHCDTLSLSSRMGATERVQCPSPVEGRLARTDPFAADAGDDGYVTTAIVNRFDLRRPNDCGEYRIVFGKKSGQQGRGERNLLIFEGRLAGLDGKSSTYDRCAPFEWAWLSAARRGGTEYGEFLKNLFFRGNVIGAAPEPLLHYHAYTGNGVTGQIRTNSLGEHGWTLRQYRLDDANTACDSQGKQCLVMRPMRLKNSSHSFAMLGASNPNAGLTFFQGEFVTKDVKSLLRVGGDAARTIGGIGASMNAEGLAWESGEAFFEESDWAAQVINNGSNFFRDIDQVVKASGRVSGPNAITTEQLLNRATAQSCIGCHARAVGRQNR